MLTPWLIAMIGLAPFVLWATWQGDARKAATWSVLLAAALAGKWAAKLTMADVLAAFVAIDLVCGILILRVIRPLGTAQKVIGALFVLMAVFGLGFYWSPRSNWSQFALALSVFGWIQWAVLGAWTSHDIWRTYRIGHRVAHHRTAREGHSR